ncbi:MAG: flagellar biosynthesis anti-sigma factor FlgM [Woeseiaceae bacterium]|nr:flagellar biosynthesis anti-sigma factor FlgM [Woeseiaceae bacterium]
MTNRIGPMDHGAISKTGNKVEDTSVERKVGNDTNVSRDPRQDSVSSGDTVNLTSGAKLLERLEKNLASLPPVDENRVAEVKSAIENGDYEIDSRAIADAMLRFERSLSE